MTSNMLWAALGIFYVSYGASVDSPWMIALGSILLAYEATVLVQRRRRRPAPVPITKRDQEIADSVLKYGVEPAETPFTASDLDREWQAHLRDCQICRERD